MKRQQNEKELRTAIHLAIMAAIPLGLEDAELGKVVDHLEAAQKILTRRVANGRDVSPA